MTRPHLHRFNHLCLLVIDRLPLAGLHTEMALGTDAAGETSISLLLCLFLCQDQLHLSKVPDPLCGRLHRNGRPRGEVHFLARHPLIDLFLGEFGHRKRDLFSRGEEIDTSQISIDGEGPSSTVGNRLDQDAGSPGCISSCEDAGPIGGRE